MAREGLRTLVVAKRALTEEQYQDFEVSRPSSPSAPLQPPAGAATLVWAPRAPSTGASALGSWERGVAPRGQASVEASPG